MLHTVTAPNRLLIVFCSVLEFLSKTLAILRADLGQIIWRKKTQLTSSIELFWKTFNYRVMPSRWVGNAIGYSACNFKWIFVATGRSKFGESFTEDACVGSATSTFCCVHCAMEGDRSHRRATKRVFFQEKLPSLVLITVCAIIRGVPKNLQPYKNYLQKMLLPLQTQNESKCRRHTKKTKLRRKWKSVPFYRDVSDCFQLYEDYSRNSRKVPVFPSSLKVAS